MVRTATIRANVTPVLCRPRPGAGKRCEDAFFCGYKGERSTVEHGLARCRCYSAYSIPSGGEQLFMYVWMDWLTIGRMHAWRGSINRCTSVRKELHTVTSAGSHTLLQLCTPIDSWIPCRVLTLVLPPTPFIIPAPSPFPSCALYRANTGRSQAQAATSAAARVACSHPR